MTNPTMAEHFGWHVHPFSDTWRLTPPFYSRYDRRISDQAILLLQHGKSFAITGPSGTGKSTLVEHLLLSLDANYYRTIHIHYAGLKRQALLKALAEKLGVEVSGHAVPLLTKLQRHISTLATGTHPVYPVILIDDAQLLERQSFMDLCSLIVCPPKKTATASLILTGDEVLAQQMMLSVMVPIRTRLTVNFPFEPLSEQETEQFIAFRLEHAKAPKDLFEPDALTLVAAHCHGNRRKIMNIATVLLNEAYYRKEKTICAQLLTNCDFLN